MYKILLEIILTNQCNKRCEYCDLDFRNTALSYEQLERCIAFLEREAAYIEYLHVNFFWGEPLLEFEKLKYFIEHISLKNIKFSIGTNGVLLDQDKLDFFIKNNVSIHMSVDNITGISWLKKLDFSSYKNIEINFIQDPDFLFQSQKIADDINQLGIKNINFMPVFATKKWSHKRFVEVGKVLKYLYSFSERSIQLFWYYNGFSAEKQFILDTDGFFYNDLDSLLWLQKQYSITQSETRAHIETVSKNMSLDAADISLKNLFDGYNEPALKECVLWIPKTMWLEKDYILLADVLTHVKQKFWV